MRDMNLPLHNLTSRLLPKRQRLGAKAIASGSPDVVRLAQTVSEQDRVIEQKSLVIEEQKKRIAVLEEYLRLERLNRYGRSSEKYAGQDELFNEVEALAADTTTNEMADVVIEESESEDVAEKELAREKRKAGRKPLSSSIPREQVYLNLSDEEKAGAIDTFYTVAKEELDITPAKVRVLEYLQEKAVFAEIDAEGHEKRTIKVAERPQHPLGQSIASISLLAYIIVAKYCDGLPLYRLEKILTRYGGTITRTAMANWMIRLAVQLQPLINLMREHQLAHPYIQADETRIQVLKEVGRSALSDKYMWVTLGGPPDQPATLFEYDPSRSKEVPLRLLEGFSGYLQTDGYAGYDAVCKAQGITHLGCMDHVRRKFHSAQKAQPKINKMGKASHADIALCKLRKLYKLEREIKPLSAEEKYQQRQNRSMPLLEDFKRWVDENSGKVAKDSLTYKAMAYAINQWPKLIRYCDDGNLHMSNILAENAIRPFVIGRKAWLFADTPKGAHASALFYSLVETAKANGLEPYEYLHAVLKRVPYAKTVEDYEALLAWNFKRVIK